MFWNGIVTFISIIIVLKKLNKNGLFAPYFNESIKIERFLIKLKETINWMYMNEFLTNRCMILIR